MPWESIDLVQGASCGERPSNMKITSLLVLGASEEHSNFASSPFCALFNSISVTILARLWNLWYLFSSTLTPVSPRRPSCNRYTKSLHTSYFSYVRDLVFVFSVVRSVVHPIGALPQSSGWVFTPPSEHAAMPLLQTCHPRTLLASSPIALSSTGLHLYLILALRTWIASAKSPRFSRLHQARRPRLREGGTVRIQAFRGKFMHCAFRGYYIVCALRTGHFVAFSPFSHK